MLELQGAPHATGLPAHNDEWSHEAEHIEVPSQFVGVPHLAVLDFQSLPARRIGVDLGGTNLRIAAVNQQGDLMEKVTLGTRDALGKDHVAMAFRILHAALVLERDVERARRLVALPGHGLLLDRDGTLWVATWGGGLDRFDGQRIVEYKPVRGDPSSLANGRVNTLLEDRAGRLWIGTQAGLQRYDRERDRFEMIRLPPGGRELENVQGLAPDAGGRVFVDVGVIVLVGVPHISPHGLP